MYDVNTNKYIGWIYCIENKINGKKYIGQTTRTLEERFYEHKYNAKTNHNDSHMLIPKAINKYGENNFKYYGIQKVEKNTNCSLKNELDRLEIEYIKIYKSFYMDNGYNLTYGGKSAPDNSKTQIDQYNLDGIFIKSWKSIVECVESLGFQSDSGRSGISCCCRGEKLSAFGYVWRYKGESFNKYRTEKLSKYPRVGVDIYDTNGNFIESLDDRETASEKYSIGIGTIANICNGVQSNYQNKYVFRNTNDQFFKYNTSKEFDPIYCFSLDGKLVKTYRCSLTDITRELGFGNSSLSVVLNNVNNTLGGYWWSTTPVFSYDISYKKETSVDLYDLSGNLLNTFDSISECAKFIKANVSNVSANCLGKKLTVSNYVVRYKGDDFNKYPIIKDNGWCSKKVNKYTKDGKYICTYNSIAEATSDCTKVKSSAISNCCRKVKSFNTAYGYKWYFIDDVTQPDKTRIKESEYKR